MPSTVPLPDQVHWLAPETTPPGVRLVEAHRELIAGCGPNADCVLTVPSAELVYDTDDLTLGRSVRIRQALPGPDDLQATPVDGTPRSIGERDVWVNDYGGSAQFIDVTWTEPSGIIVTISSSGLTPEQLDALVESMSAVGPGQWPGSEVQPLGRCVDEQTRYAPTVVPDGWVRYVLDAHPTGTCEVDSFLWMSLVEPGTVDEPGILVNLSVTPASATAPVQPGDPISINGHPATVLVTEDPIMGIQTSITLRVGAVAIEAHGNVTPEALEQIMSTVALLDEAHWAELVASVDTGE